MPDPKLESPELEDPEAEPLPEFISFAAGRLWIAYEQPAASPEAASKALVYEVAALAVERNADGGLSTIPYRLSGNGELLPASVEPPTCSLMGLFHGDQKTVSFAAFEALPWRREQQLAGSPRRMRKALGRHR